MYGEESGQWQQVWVYDKESGLYSEESGCVVEGLGVQRRVWVVWQRVWVFSEEYRCTMKSPSARRGVWVYSKQTPLGAFIFLGAWFSSCVSSMASRIFANCAF